MKWKRQVTFSFSSNKYLPWRAQDLCDTKERKVSWVVRSNRGFLVISIITNLAVPSSPWVPSPENPSAIISSESAESLFHATLMWAYTVNKMENHVAHNSCRDCCVNVCHPITYFYTCYKYCNVILSHIYNASDVHRKYRDITIYFLHCAVDKCLQLSSQPGRTHRPLV